MTAHEKNRRDDNEPAIVATIRGLGCEWLPMDRHAGFDGLIVSPRTGVHICEIKNPARKWKYTQAEAEMKARVEAVGGLYHTLLTPEQAADLCGQRARIEMNSKTIGTATPGTSLEIDTGRIVDDKLRAELAALRAENERLKIECAVNDAARKSVITTLKLDEGRGLISQCEHLRDAIDELHSIRHNLMRDNAALRARLDNEYEQRIRLVSEIDAAHALLEKARLDVFLEVADMVEKQPAINSAAFAELIRASAAPEAGGGE